MPTVGKAQHGRDLVRLDISSNRKRDEELAEDYSRDLVELLHVGRQVGCSHRTFQSHGAQAAQISNEV
jgi:hypothetical protein